MPFPSQEHNAIDAVVQYAKKELGFQENQLVFFGWSIGGYTATWAAVKYPACKALVSYVACLRALRFVFFDNGFISSPAFFITYAGTNI